jgi:hypothetical protein
MVISRREEFFLDKPIVEYHPETGIVDPLNYSYRLSTGDYYSGINIIELCTNFLQDKNVDRLTHLIIGLWDHEGGSSKAIVDLLVSSADKLPNLKALFIGDITYKEYEISWIEQSDLSGIITTYKQLEYLRIRGNNGLSLGELKHHTLRTLIIETGGLSVNIIRQICNGQLPALQHLELWLGTEEYGGDAKIEDITPILYLGGNLFPQLNYLGLRDSEIADQIAIAIASAPILEKIKHLDLSMGTLGDEGAKALLNSVQLENLEKLDLHHHYISEDLCEQLTNECQKRSIDLDISDVRIDGEYRYVAVSE